MTSSESAPSSDLLGLFGPNARDFLNNKGRVVGTKTFDEAVHLAGTISWPKDFRVSPSRRAIYFVHSEGYIGFNLHSQPGLEEYDESRRLTLYRGEGIDLKGFIEKAVAHPVTAGLIAMNVVALQEMQNNGNFDQKYLAYGIGIDRKFIGA